MARIFATDLMPEHTDQPSSPELLSMNLNPTARMAYALDHAVGAIYRLLGAHVQHNAVLAGVQVDLLVRIEVSPGKFERLAVECKSYSKLVGLKTIERFTRLIELLR